MSEAVYDQGDSQSCFNFVEVILIYESTSPTHAQGNCIDGIRN